MLPSLQITRANADGCFFPAENAVLHRNLLAARAIYRKAGYRLRGAADLAGAVQMTKPIRRITRP